MRFKVAKLMYKYDNRLLVRSFDNCFVLKVSQIHARLTRSTENNLLYLPGYRSNRLQRFIKYKTIWLKIPSNFKYFSTYSSFAKHYKKHIIDST